MKSARLLRLIGDVDASLIDMTPMEELIKKKTAHSWVKWAAVAACVALVVSGVIGCGVKGIGDARVLYPVSNTPYETPESTGLSTFSTMGVKEPYTYSLMANEADVVIIADVISCEAGNTKVFCRNYVCVSIREVFKGDVKKGDIVCVADPTSDIYSNNQNDIMMQKGNRVLLFLTASTQTMSFSQGADLTVYQFVREYPSIGKFFYDSDKKYHCVQSYGNYPAFFWEAFYADITPKSLEEIKEMFEEK